MNPDRLQNPALKRSFFVTKPEPFEANTSGVEPVGTKLLVLTDSIADMTAGGIQLTPDKVEQMTLAITTGVIAAVGGASFSDWPNSDRKWPGSIPKVGDRIHLAKYAGLMIEGADMKHYRLIHDTDVCGFETGEHKKQVFSAPAGQA